MTDAADQRRDAPATRPRRPGAFARLWGSAYVLLTFTALAWAGNSVVGRAARDLVPPVALAFWRWTIALALLLLLAWPHLRRDWPALRASGGTVVLLGVLGIGAFNTLLYAGLQHTTAVNATLLQGAQPVLILALGLALFRDRVGPAQAAGVALSLLGVLVIIGRGDPAVVLGLDLNAGDMTIAFAVLLWSLYSVLLRNRPAVHPLSFLAATLTVGVAAILPFYAAEVMSGRLIAPGAASALAIGYVAIFPSLLAYACFNRGVELIGAAATGQFMNVMPAFGAALAVLFLGERLHAFHAAGVALVVAGILLARRAAKP